MIAERTNASTTGLLRIADREWDDELIDRLGYPRQMFPELVDAGTVIGEVQSRVAFEGRTGRSDRTRQRFGAGPRTRIRFR